MKAFASFITVLLINLYVLISNYIDRSREIDPEVYSYAPEHIFTVGMLIGLALFMLLIMPLSTVVDGFILSKSYKPTLVKVIAFIIGYGILAVICTVIFNLFIFNFSQLGSFMFMFLIGVYIYLFIQYILQIILIKLKNRYKR